MKFNFHKIQVHSCILTTTDLSTMSGTSLYPIDENRNIYLGELRSRTLLLHMIAGDVKM